MATWTRQRQERPGDYFFSGRAFMTAGVKGALTPIEIVRITSDLRRAVREEEGLDYLQVFRCDDGRTVWAIDQLSRSMKENGSYTREQIQQYDYWTLLLPDEY